MNETYLGLFTGWDLLVVVVLVVAIAFLIRIMMGFIEESVAALYKKKGTNELDLETVPWRDPVDETELAYVFRDGYPVTSGHLLFVPKYNTIEAISHCLTSAYTVGDDMLKEGIFDGFNVGMNNGEAAGQTVMWPHIHLIPRRTGDMQDPTGGVRHVIPVQGNYRVVGYKLPK